LAILEIQGKYNRITLEIQSKYNSNQLEKQGKTVHCDRIGWILPVHLLTSDMTWGKEIDKDNYHTFGFLCKQGSPMAFYEDALVMNPNPPVN
jgi:hypothetical protein